MAAVESISMGRGGPGEATEFDFRGIHQDFDLCYRAVQSRDSRFDGRFFTAVTSTGIYCRPICPARTPQPENVRFYGCAAAAEAAGFRPCQRCRPEAAPGSAEWSAQDHLIGRALTLIAEGVVDEEGVGGLVERLAVGERHLHRLLVAAVGAGPLALARTRRLQMAKSLIEQTAMPLTEVAFAAGFSSVRQFNEAVRQSYGRSPSEIRSVSGSADSEAKSIQLRLHYRPPLDWDSMLGFLARRAVPGVEEVVGRRYRRSVAMDGIVGIVELEPIPSQHQLLMRLEGGDPRRLPLVVQGCRYLLDLDANPAAVEAVLGADPILGPYVAARPGLRVPGAMDGFELAVRAILGQLVSMAEARTMLGRLVSRLGTPLPAPSGSVTHLFPRAELLATADLSTLGITRARASAIRALAGEVAAGRLYLGRGADWEETARRLLAIPGIGPWTVAYISMRALGNPDALPVGDLGLRRALEGLALPAGEGDLERIAEGWRPWRAYGAMHLWSGLATGPSVAATDGQEE